MVEVWQRRAVTQATHSHLHLHTMKTSSFSDQLLSTTDKIAKEKIHQHLHVTAETIEKDISQEKDRKIEQEERSNLKIGELAICHVQEKVLINQDTSKIISIVTKTKT